MKMAIPVIAECYRTMTKEELEDVCSAMSKYFRIANELLPITGADAMEKAFKEMDQES